MCCLLHTNQAHTASHLSNVNCIRCIASDHFQLWSLHRDMLTYADDNRQSKWLQMQSKCTTFVFTTITSQVRTVPITLASTASVNRRHRSRSLLCCLHAPSTTQTEHCAGGRTRLRGQVQISIQACLLAAVTRMLSCMMVFMAPSCFFSRADASLGCSTDASTAHHTTAVRVSCEKESNTQQTEHLLVLTIQHMAGVEVHSQACTTRGLGHNMSDVHVLWLCVWQAQPTVLLTGKECALSMQHADWMHPTGSKD